MIIQLEFNESSFQVNLGKPIDISIPLGQVKCFYAPDWKKEPVVAGDFIGSVQAGAPVNFYNVFFNPHGQGTHTECLGHITKAQEFLNDCLSNFHFIAQVVSIPLQKAANGDQIIGLDSLRKRLKAPFPEALIIRTMPNDSAKLGRDYSGQNPPYLGEDTMRWIVDQGIQHLLLDLPSVDREDDGGKLTNHRAFWKVLHNEADEQSRFNSTITELIFVPEAVEDGLYLLNLQIPTIELDAAPSKPVLYPLIKQQ